MGCQPLAPIKKVQLNYKTHTANVGSQLVSQLGRCFRSTSGSQQIVNNQNALSGLNCVLVNLQCVGTVLEIVGVTHSLTGEFLCLTDGNESRVQTICHRGS